MEGDHRPSRCDRVTHAVLAEVFTQFRVARVDLRAMVLKPSMVLPGQDGPGASIDDVAAATLRALADTVPATVPGVAFLSGGQASGVASAHLDAMARQGPHPWTLTFSFGRALQNDAIRAWRGQPENVTAAQAALLRRVRSNSDAAQGRYDVATEAA